MLPRFVGRVEELALLEADLTAAAGGTPRAVVVGGEAGVGKTRLVEELAAHAVAKGATVVVGSAIECADVPLPYGAVAEALRSLVRALADDPRRQHLDRARAELARLVPELARDESPSSWSDGADGTARGRLFETVLALFDQVARDQPVVLVLEDLHWADRSSRDLLSFLVRNLSARVLLVATYRSDEQPRGHPLRQFVAELSRSRRVRVVELTPLSRPELVAHLTDLNDGRPSPEVVETVWERSEGNPFFAEELLAAATQGDGRGLPPTLHDLLLGVVQALSPDAQHVVRVAAAGGRRVSHRLLAEVVDVPEPDLLAALREAVAHQVLVPDPDHAGYGFRHALLHEAAYDELLPGERTRVHAAYGRQLQDRPELLGSADGVAAELARHWSAAQEQAAALAASVVAAAAAETACGFAEAHRHLERAVELWEHVVDDDRPAGLDWSTLVERAAENAHLAGDNRRAAALVGLAIDGDTAADAVRRGLLHERLGCYLAAAGHSEDALTAYAEAVRHVPAEVTPERARVLVAEARALLLAARYRESQARAEEAADIGRQAGARLEVGQALGTLGFDLAMLGRPDVGVEYLRDALAIAIEVHDLPGIASAYRQLAVVLSGPLSRLDEGLAVAQEGLARLQQLRLDRNYGVSLQALAADTLFRLGRWDDADAIVDAALHHDPTGSAAIDLHLARVKLSIGRGRFDAAADDLRSAAELSARAVDAQFNVPRSTLLAGLALWQGRLDDARAAVAQALHDLADTDELWLLGPVLWHGLRVEAEAASEARALRRSKAVDDAQAAGRALLDRARLADGFGASDGGPLGVLLAAYTTMCEGEASRIEGAEDPVPWATAADAWDRLGQPYPASYCRWRQAEARLAQGDRSAQPVELVRQAHATAVELGAHPLREAIGRLADRARVDLDSGPSEAREPEPESPDLGLTKREVQVLSLVSTGRTNREIAEVLFISEKTASVHVSNIITKLGVRSRVEAAGVAQRLGVEDVSAER